MKVTEHEMRGLLAGKCVPGDMLVNEDLPAYLVRKFVELHKRLEEKVTDKYYVSGCKIKNDKIITCDDSEACFWSLYQRMRDGTSQGLLELRFREDAEAVMAIYAERDALQRNIDKLLASTPKVLNMFKKQQLEAHCRDVIANPQDHLDWVVDMARVALASLEAELGPLTSSPP